MAEGLGVEPNEPSEGLWHVSSVLAYRLPHLPRDDGGEWRTRTPMLAHTLVFKTSRRPFSGTLHGAQDQTRTDYDRFCRPALILFSFLCANKLGSLAWIRTMTLTDFESAPSAVGVRGRENFGGCPEIRTQTASLANGFTDRHDKPYSPDTRGTRPRTRTGKPCF